MPPSPDPVAAPQDAIDLLAGQTLPLALPELRRAGRRTVLGEKASNPLRFSFAFDRVLFDAKADYEARPRLLRLTADLGPLPFTAEGKLARQALLALKKASDHDPPSMTLSRDHHLIAGVNEPLGEPSTPAALIADLTLALLRLRPLLSAAHRCVAPIS